MTNNIDYSSKAIQDDLWQAVMTEFQLLMTEAQYGMFVKKMFIKEIIGTDRLTVVLGVPFPLWKDILKNRYGDLFKETFERLTNLPVEMEFVIASPPVAPRNSHSQSQEDLSLAPLFEKIEKPSSKLEYILKEHRLEPERNLDTYAVSTSNEMAYAAAKAVASRPGSAYNPLFLYGGVGVGKTHLMQAVGQEILKKKSETRLIYCTGEEFTNAIIEAIQKKSTSKFRNKYRKVELLLIDDIQFIAGKNSVQEEFFHTFNAITTSGGQVIMTSDKPPKEIDSLEDRLRSRFEGGLTVDIGNPNFELRCAIIMIKAEHFNIEMPTEVVQFIATHVEDTRALVGRLLSIISLSEQRNQSISLELAQAVIKDHQDKVNKFDPPTPEKVISYVCQHYEQPTTEVLGKSRQKQFTLPRHIAMYILKEDLKMNLVDIGTRFSKRDHTTVMHAVEKISDLVHKNSEIRDDLESLRLKLHVN